MAWQSLKGGNRKSQKTAEIRDFSVFIEFGKVCFKAHLILVSLIISVFLTQQI